MRVRHRQEQGARPRPRERPAIPPSFGAINRDGFVHVDPGFQEDAHDRQPSFSHRKQEGREAGRQTRANVRAGGDQRLRDVGMTFGGGPHERGLAARLVFAVSRRAVREQRFDRGEVAGARGGHQRRLAARQRQVRVGAGFQQPFDQGAVPVRAGDRERRHAIARRRLDARAGAHEQLHHLAIVVLRRPVQRRHAVGLRRVNGDALGHERAHARPVALLCGISER